MTPLVTVIVTCYNHEQYIKQCLESVFAQSYRNIQLVVMNDGSTDESGRIIEQCLTVSPFEDTRYVHQDNAGIVVTRNNAFQYINGEFLLFVDSDNFLDQDYIEQLLDALFQENADIAYGNLYDPDKEDFFMIAKPFDVATLLIGNYIDNCSLIRTKVIGATRYDIQLNRKMLEDYDFILNLIINGHARPVYCKNTKLNYRVLPDSISRKGNNKEEAYYYAVYLYILKKYMNPQNEVVFEALQQTVLNLEKRISDLVAHLDDVTLHIHNQEGQIAKLNDEIQLITNDFSKKLKASENNLNDMRIINEELNNQKNQVLASNSYRVGNAIVKPAKYVVKLVKNPKAIKPYLGRAKRYLIRKTQPFKAPQKFFYQPIRAIQRKKNNYTNPSRVLVYVIYENRSEVQDYKVLFLEALTKLVDRVLIVVNGELSEKDTSRLGQYGEVVTRSNEGYDTAAFRYGIQYLGKEVLSQYDELLLINDTNVGPFGDLKNVFQKMAEKKVDFWGITYGEPQPDFTGYNKYKTIPIHLQSFFLVIEKSMLTFDGFYDYWEALGDTNSREKAIGKHETVFTTHFANLGFKHSAVTPDNHDSAIYIRPFSMLKSGVPLVKYTAFGNYDSDQFAWQGLIRESEIPELLTYIAEETNYPMSIINEIMSDMKNRQHNDHILVIDGVENALPQLTKYRVDNKVEQLKSLGFKVWKINASGFQMGYAADASHIIIYRAAYNDQLRFMCQLARKYGKPVLYDIDDLVIDTKYTDQLTYTQEISATEKANYDAGVNSYGTMMKLCDGAITSTKKLKEELENYQSLVLLNRNLASKELVEISHQHLKDHQIKSDRVSIGYFSGSITHNENFELIKPAILRILEKYPNVDLHIVGYLDLPDEMVPYKKRIITHPFVSWQELPKLISQVDINLAPLVKSVFNEAKSEIKWIEASLVKVPTIASDIGAFKEMVQNGVTGYLVKDDQWFSGLEKMITEPAMREKIALQGYEYVMEHCTTDKQEDELTNYLRSSME